MSERPPIFIITGVPGTGKSSVAAELMRRFAYGLHLPVDDLREFVVSGIAHPVPEWTAETERQFTLARTAAAQIAALYNQSGFAVAIDDVIAPLEAQSLLVEALAGARILKVLLYPGVEATLERNAQRLNKQFDTATLEGVIRRLHASAKVELYAEHGWTIVDNSAQTVTETVDAILHGLPSAEHDRPNVDKRGMLDEEVFSYRTSRDKVFIAWHGKQVMILKGKEAARFLAKIDGLAGKEAQLVMAKITGNFKRGNER